MKILANDGIPQEVKSILEKKGGEIVEIKVAHEQLVNYITKNAIDILIVKNGILLNKQMIGELKSLKAIVFSGTSINLELIDYIQSNGIKVIWAEESLSNATAEMVFAHLFSGCRFLQESNRNMPLEGDSSFKMLQKSYANGVELSGKTLGIIGMNKAGKKVAQKALGLGMKVVYCDNSESQIKTEFILPNGICFKVELNHSNLEEVIEQAHFLTVHTKYYERYLLNQKHFGRANQLLGVINCTYPEAINEVDLVDAINEERLLFAGIDRFEEEPHPAIQVLMQPAFSLSPNINASTNESTILIWDEILNNLEFLLK